MLKEKGLSLIDVLFSMSISSIIILGLLKSEMHLFLFQSTMIKEAKALMNTFNQRQLMK